jgi:hypothetical protein
MSEAIPQFRSCQLARERVGHRSKSGKFIAKVVSRGQRLIHPGHVTEPCAFRIAFLILYTCFIFVIEKTPVICNGIDCDLRQVR